MSYSCRLTVSMVGLFKTNMSHAVNPISVPVNRLRNMFTWKVEYFDFNVWLTTIVKDRSNIDGKVTLTTSCFSMVRAWPLTLWMNSSGAWA